MTRPGDGFRGGLNIDQMGTSWIGCGSVFKGREALRRLKSRIYLLMLVIAYVAIGFAALRSSSLGLGRTLYALTVVLLAFGTLSAFCGNRPSRWSWTGFATFGWSYFVAFMINDSPNVDLFSHHFLWIIRNYVNPEASEVVGLDQTKYYNYISNGNCLLLFFSGIVGAVLGQLLGAHTSQDRTEA